MRVLNRVCNAVCENLRICHVIIWDCIVWFWYAILWIDRCTDVTSYVSFPVETCGYIHLVINGDVCVCTLNCLWRLVCMYTQLSLHKNTPNKSTLWAAACFSWAEWYAVTLPTLGNSMLTPWVSVQKSSLKWLAVRCWNPHITFILNFCHKITRALLRW